jgi:hypothetical protein
VCKKLGAAHLTFLPLRSCASRFLGSCVRKTSLWRLIHCVIASIQISVINFLFLCVNKYTSIRSESDLRNKRRKLHDEEVQSLCSLTVTAKMMKWTRH